MVESNTATREDVGIKIEADDFFRVTAGGLATPSFTMHFRRRQFSYLERNSIAVWLIERLEPRLCSAVLVLMI